MKKLSFSDDRKVKLAMTAIRAGEEEVHRGDNRG
jgi:hypothetical protein